MDDVHTATWPGKQDAQGEQVLPVRCTFGTSGILEQQIGAACGTSAALCEHVCRSMATPDDAPIFSLCNVLAQQGHSALTYLPLSLFHQQVTVTMFSIFQGLLKRSLSDSNDVVRRCHEVSRAPQ